MKKISDLLARHKTAWCVVLLLGVLVFIYCVLSLIVTDSVGLPFQRTTTFTQAEVYAGLTGFDIEGQVIFSNTDEGFLFLNTSDAPSFGNVTLFTQRLSDPRRGIRLWWRDEYSDFTGANQVWFRHSEGMQTIRIPSGEWAEIRVLLGTREDMSMIVDSVVLSRFPIVPAYFPLLFLGIVLVVCVLWYFIVFRNLGKFLAAHPMIILAALILIQAFTMAYYVDQKRGFHIDECLSLTQANGRLVGGQAHWDSRMFNNWNDSQYFRDFYTVQPGERFDFESVYRTISRNVHPPLYHMQLHAISSMFVDSWNIWMAAFINIFWLSAATFVFYKAAYLIFKNHLYSLLASIGWGFSSGIISNATFFRMYATLTFFFIALSYLGLKVIMDKTKIDIKFCVCLGLVIFFGFLTQYYFIIFFAFSAFLILAYLVLQKNYKGIIKCIITTAASLGIYHLIWAHSVRHITQSSRGIQAFDYLARFYDALERIRSYFVIVDRELFGSAFMVFLTLLAVIAVFSIVLIKIRKISLKVLLSGGFPVFFLIFTALGYFLVVAHISPLLVNRYMFPVYPVIMLSAMAVCYHFSATLGRRCTTVLFIILAVFLVQVNFQNRVLTYLYPRNPDTHAIISSFESPTAIMVRGADAPDWQVNRFLFDFSLFEQVFITSSLEYFELALDDIASGTELILYVHRNLEQEEILEQLNKTHPFQMSRKLVTSDFLQYGFNIYQIIW